MYELETEGIVIKSHHNLAILREWATINVSGYWEIYHVGVKWNPDKRNGKGHPLHQWEQIAIKKERDKGIPVRELANKYMTSEQTIYKIINENL